LERIPDLTDLRLKTVPPVKYSRSALGGTFDHLHVGHKRLIATAAAVSDEILIGVTSDEFVLRSKGSKAQSFEERKAALVRYLSEIDALERSRIVPLDDPFGPALTEVGLDAIFVTVDTVGNALELNRARRGSGLRALEIVIVPKAFSEAGGFVSSTRIRAGEIDEGGKAVRLP